MLLRWYGVSVKRVHRKPCSRHYGDVQNGRELYRRRCDFCVLLVACLVILRCIDALALMVSWGSAVDFQRMWSAGAGEKRTEHSLWSKNTHGRRRKLRFAALERAMEFL